MAEPMDTSDTSEMHDTPDPQNVRREVPPADGFLQSLNFARQGLKEVFQTQQNFRTDLGIAVLVVSAGAFVRLEAWEWVAVLLLIGWVLATECLNTALEALADLASGGAFHPLARTAKDISAGACLIAAIFSVIIGLIIFVPHLLPAR